MWLPGVQEDWIQRRVHGSDHIVHPVRRNSEGSALAWVRNMFILSRGESNAVYYLGLMRLATVMMSLRLAGALTFAPEPIVIATSFSVKVWQICTWKCYVYVNQWIRLRMDKGGRKKVIYL